MSGTRLVRFVDSGQVRRVSDEEWRQIIAADAEFVEVVEHGGPQCHQEGDSHGTRLT